MRKNSEIADRLRQTAYFLWEHDGRPDGRAFDYWVKAKESLLRELAYDKWLAEGTPIGRDQEIWLDAVEEIEKK